MKRSAIRVSVVSVAAWLVTLVGPGAGAVTLEEYLESVRMSHPFFEREAMESEIATKRSERYLGGEDWLLDVSPVYRHQEPPQRSPFDPERIDELRIDAGASRAIWRNGSTVRAYASTDFVDQEVPGFSIPSPSGTVEIPISPSRFYQHVVGATWSLPLLKNRGGSLDRLEYELSRYDVDAKEVAALERQEDFMLGVALKFVRWALVDEQLRIARARLELAERELERTRRKREANLVDEADVFRSENAVYLAQNAVVLVEARFEATRAELATIGGGAVSSEARPQFDLYDREDVPDADASIRGIAGSSRLVRRIDIERARIARFESGLEEQTRAELSLDLGAAFVGGNDELDRSFEMTNPDVFVGLSLRYPLGNRTARADVEEARLRARQIELSRNEVILELTASLRAVIAEMEKLKRAVEVNERRIETAGQKTKAELELYEQGRGDLTFVIQSRDGEAVARLALAEACATYQTLMLQYQALVDELLAPIKE